MRPTSGAKMARIASRRAWLASVLGSEAPDSETIDDYVKGLEAVAERHGLRYWRGLSEAALLTNARQSVKRILENEGVNNWILELIDQDQKDREQAAAAAAIAEAEAARQLRLLEDPTAAALWRIVEQNDQIVSILQRFEALINKESAAV